MKTLLPLALLLCCLAVGCQHAAPVATASSPILLLEAKALALSFAYEDQTPTAPLKAEEILPTPVVPTPECELHRMESDSTEIAPRFYGYCPQCGAKGVSRTRDLNPQDTCENGHTYPSVKCLKWRPGQEPIDTEKAKQTDQEKYGPHPNGPEGDYGPTQYRLFIDIAGYQTEKDSEIQEVMKFATKNNLTVSTRTIQSSPTEHSDSDIQIRIIESREELLVHQKYGWGYWHEPLKEDLLPNAGTWVHDSVGTKYPFELIFAPLTEQRLQKLWDERKPRTKDHYNGYVPRFNGSEDQRAEAAPHLPEPEPIKPRFEARMPPQGTGRKLVMFTASWCAPCRPTKANFESFVSSRELDATEWGIVDTEPQFNKYNIGSIPTILLIDLQGNEIARITGRASFEEIEDLWLSGQKRPHNLSGVPVNQDIASILQNLPALIKSASFKTSLAQQLNIPIPNVGEIVIPQNVSLVAGPVTGGFRVAVETGTAAPWVKSKWMGSLYPIPITAISVVGKKATIELRGWQDLVIALE